MSLFPVTSANLCAFDASAVVAADTFRHGILLRPNEVTKAALAGDVNTGVGGLRFNSEGAVLVEDTLAGLPPGTVYNNGIPISPAGAVCVADDAAVVYNQGMPYTANGSIAGFIV